MSRRGVRKVVGDPTWLPTRRAERRVTAAGLDPRDPESYDPSELVRVRRSTIVDASRSADPRYRKSRRGSRVLPGLPRGR